MKLAIVTATYQRRDGSTPALLKKCIESVLEQTHEDFQFFVIGDRYEDPIEFDGICSQYNSAKIYFENLPHAHERDVYKDKEVLWAYGGTYAYNYGIQLALDNGYDYICHLDHDDYWYSNHLSIINKLIEERQPVWMCTKAHHFNNTTLPDIETDNSIIPYIPVPERLIHSSVCMDFRRLPFRYRNVYAETGHIGYPGDADLWNRVSNHLIQTNQTGYLINTITCNHYQEGYERF